MPDKNGDENPYLFGAGDEHGPTTRLVDEYGNVHWFPTHSARQIAPGAEPPFVLIELGEQLAQHGEPLAIGLVRVHALRDTMTQPLRSEHG